MSIHGFYRTMVWLPLGLPLIALAAVVLFGMPAWEPLQEATGWYLYSLVYGGIPYALLAIWATVWIDHRPEREIRRLVHRAPLLMIGAYALFMVALAIRIAATEQTVSVAVRVAGGVFALGTVFILLLGYVYVGLVLALRTLLVPEGASVRTPA